MLVHRLLADLILLLHFAFVLFVIIGLVLIVAGLAMRWRWVRNFWFRAAHLIAIGVVVGQQWGGVLCPLTKLENHLRRQAGDADYPGSFIAYWADRLLFYEAEPWVFTLCYTLFGALVVGALILGPPRWPRRAHA